MEVINKVEERRDFNEWLKSKYPLTDCSWEYDIYSTYPDTAKIALIQEWFREEKGVIIIPDIDRPKNKWFSWLISDVLHNYYEKSKSYNENLEKSIEQALKLID